MNEGTQRRTQTLALCDAVMSLTAVPTPKDQRATTALIIFLGGGNRHTCDLRLLVHWPEFTDKVWVAGLREDVGCDLEVVQHELTRKRRYPSKLRNQGWVLDLNTKGQMHWAVEQVLSDLTIDHVILSTAKYHLARCALTFAKMWLEHGDGRKLRISVLPTPDPNPEEVAEVIGTNTSPEAELGRVEAYQDKGDVATAEEFEHFLEWSR